MRKRIWTNAEFEYFKTEQDYLNSDYRYLEDDEIREGLQIYGIGWDSKFQTGILRINHMNSKNMLVHFGNEFGGVKILSKPVWDAPAFKWETVYSPIYIKK